MSTPDKGTVINGEVDTTLHYQWWSQLHKSIQLTA